MSKKNKFQKFLQEIFLKKVIGIIYSAISLACSIIGIPIIQIYKYNFGIDHVYWSFILLSVTLFSLLGRTIYVFYKYYQQNSESSKELAAIKSITKITQASNNFINCEVDLSTVLTNYCNELSNCMSEITSSNCSVSIKVIKYESTGTFKVKLSDLYGYEVSNIVRDQDHGKRDTKDYYNRKHIIRDNTAFSTILAYLQNPKSKQKFYLNNCIDLNNSYLTTSVYDESEDLKLPYNSELVFPIKNGKKTEDFTLIGFLCIDSTQQKAFNSRGIEILITETLSDSLYWILSDYLIKSIDLPNNHLITNETCKKVSPETNYQR